GGGGGHRRVAIELSCGDFREALQCAVLWRRFGPALLPYAVLVAVFGCGCTCSLANARYQLPYLAPDPLAGRPSARSRSIRCGRKRRKPQGYDFYIQWARADHL